MSAAAKKLSAATLLARHAVAGAVLTLVLAGCSSRPPAPDWALNAESASQRASTAYLEGRQRVQALEWDKARAVAFMKENSALSDANIDAEVNRYISWPGQALGYKLGEIRIRALRARAEETLGAKFDLRRFHDMILAQGAVPLTVLEAQTDAWIAAELAR